MNNLFHLAGRALAASSAKRPPLMSRPQTRGEPHSAGPPVPLELLYPSAPVRPFLDGQGFEEYLPPAALVEP